MKFLHFYDHELRTGNTLVLRRQDDRERRALADPRGDIELAAVAVEDVLDDGEPQAGAALFPARRHADPVEALRETRQVLRRDAGPVVLHRHDEAGGTAV